MSALLELSAKFGDIADRLDLSKGAGAVALRRHYIDPTMQALDAVAIKAFGPDRRPFKNKPATATIDYVIDVGGATVEFRFTPAGVWKFGQTGAKPHVIASSKKQRIHAAGYAHPLRGPLHHPGTKGKRALDNARQAIGKNLHAQIGATIDELMTGNG